MKQIRRGVFETNSSSTHSITICTEEDFKKFKDGEVLLMPYPDEKWVTRDEAIKSMKKDGYFGEDSEYDIDDEDSVDEAMRDEGIYTYDSMINGDYLESYVEKYTSPKGEKIVAFGQYGRD